MKIAVINLDKHFLVLLFFLLFCTAGYAQENVEQIPKPKNKVIHSFGFYMNNGIYVPEKIYADYGLIKRIPKARYGYEFALNYNPVIYKGLGISLDIIIWGSIPDGHYTSSNGLIKEDTLWFNSFHGDPTTTRPKNGSGLPYWGFNFKINYTFSPCKHLVIQPEIGIKLPVMTTFYDDVIEQFSDSNQTNSVAFYHHYIDNLNNKRTFFPDLIGGLNFLIYPFNAKHCIKIGFNFDYGFVPRLEGYYEVANIGTKYDSGGKVKYRSTHFGISFGYQFLGIKKNYWALKSGRNNMLFNPRY